MRINKPTIIARVNRAQFTTGSLNACTPLLTASTPVIAVHPLANAFNIIHQVTCSFAGATAGNAAAASGCPPVMNAL
jgi:hypothetical protein